jgi:hypothetical protein
MSNLRSFYSSSFNNGYGRLNAYKRFSILQDLNFSSVLDVGSGPCFLHDWLNLKNIDTTYEAVDIRDECFKHCNCVTYTSIPLKNKYDLVCLFGTVTYNINDNETQNKLQLKELLLQGKLVSNSLLIFTVFREFLRERYKNSQFPNRFVYFTKEEIETMLHELSIFNFEIIENDELDKQEYLVICRL